MFKKKVIAEEPKKPEYIRLKKYVLYFDVHLLKKDGTFFDVSRSFSFNEKIHAENALISLKKNFIIDINGIYFFFEPPEEASIIFVDSWIEEKFYYVEAGVA